MKSCTLSVANYCRHCGRDGRLSDLGVCSSCLRRNNSEAELKSFDFQYQPDLRPCRICANLSTNYYYCFACLGSDHRETEDVMWELAGHFYRSHDQVAGVVEWFNDT